MELTIYSQEGKDHYSISFHRFQKESKEIVWVSHNNEEGGCFNLNEISNILYNAIDKYFKENH